MATLSVLSYNLSQGLNMKSNENNGSSSSLANNNNNNSNSLPRTFNKITVLNVLSESKGNVLNISNNNNSGSSVNSSINNANAIVKKIKDFGMIGAVNAVNSSSISSHISTITATKAGVARKRPLSESKVSSNSLMKPTIAVATPKKPKLSTKAASTPKTTNSKKVCENVNQQNLLTQVSTTGSNSVASTPTTPTSGTPGRKGLPAPQAVARRNARERNRVKQVNNGFAALRDRIPEEVAEAFEAQGNGRATAASKKLSKVETLRMAVEYIRSLERLLGFDFPIGHNPRADNSFALIKDEFCALSPGMDEQYNDDSLSNYELDEDFAASHAQVSNNSDSHFDEQSMINDNVIDLLPNITTLNGLQYIRIPGTSTYQLLTADIFTGISQSPPTSNNNIEDEQFNSALIDTNCQSPRSASSSVTTTADDLYGSPTATVATTTLIMQTTAAAPALHQAATNGNHVRRITSSSSSSLSRSPVPQTSSSPNATRSMLQQQCQDLPTTTTTTTLSPVGNDELLLQKCADDVVLTMANNERLSVAARQQFVAPILAQQQQQQQQSLLPSHKIKQEFSETDYQNTTTELSPNISAALIYQTILQHNQQQRNQQQQQQQQQLLLQQTSMSMSPPLDRVNSSSTEIIITSPSALPSYFEPDHNRSFYDSIVTFKKERNDPSIQDTTSNNTTAVLSDESMMEAIDWWEAHTPKSDGGSVIM